MLGVVIAVVGYTMFGLLSLARRRSERARLAGDWTIHARGK